MTLSTLVFAAARVELQRTLTWMAANQPSRNSKSMFKYDSQWGGKSTK
jgi:hypothetical protein